MAECYLYKSPAASAETADDNGYPPIIREINTQYSPGDPPIIPIMNMLMREHPPHEPPGLTEMGAACVRLTTGHEPPCSTWQCDYLRQYPDLWPPPTSLTAHKEKDVLPPIKLVNKLMLSKKDIELEVAKRKLLAFYGGIYDLETICNFIKALQRRTTARGRKSKTKRKPESDSEPEDKEEEPEPDPEKEPEKEEDEEEEKEEKPKEEEKDKKIRQTGPDHPILKKRDHSIEIPRVPRAFHSHHMSPITAVNFLPGKVRLVQRYRESELNRAARRTPVIDEADQRFTLRTSSQSPPMTSSL